MSAGTKTPVGNCLIDALTSKERRHFLEHSESVELIPGEMLQEAGRIIKYVYFPVAGYLSLMTTLNEHHALETGLIGNEGMLGATLILDDTTAPMTAVVQGPGSALRMSAVDFHSELAKNPGLQKMVNHFLCVMIVQLSQLAVCSHFHQIGERLARRLLMAHDRAQSNQFQITHESLAHMLGGRRSGVTVAAGVLQFKNLISYSRGEISILDREGLQAAACGCYETPI